MLLHMRSVDRPLQVYKCLNTNMIKQIYLFVCLFVPQHSLNFYNDMIHPEFDIKNMDL